MSSRTEVTFRESFQFTYDFQFIFLTHAICYSETNLKVKQALTVTAELGEDLQKLTEFNGESMWKTHFPKHLPKHQSPESAWESGFPAVPRSLLGGLWMQQQEIGMGALQSVQQVSTAFTETEIPLHLQVSAPCMAIT